jgi:trehalose/maltose hydrolase-like predicted phosphorylase
MKNSDTNIAENAEHVFREELEKRFKKRGSESYGIIDEKSRNRRKRQAVRELVNKRKNKASSLKKAVELRKTIPDLLAKKNTASESKNKLQQINKTLSQHLNTLKVTNKPIWVRKYVTKHSVEDIGYENVQKVIYPAILKQTRHDTNKEVLEDSVQAFHEAYKTIEESITNQQKESFLTTDMTSLVGSALGTGLLVTSLGFGSIGALVGAASGFLLVSMTKRDKNAPRN